MGAKLVAIVERVRSAKNGLPNVNLARLNLLTGKPLSRHAAMLPDDPQVVRLAEMALREIVGEGERGT